VACGNDGAAWRCAVLRFIALPHSPSHMPPLWRLRLRRRASRLLRYLPRCALLAVQCTCLTYYPFLLTYPYTFPKQILWSMCAGTFVLHLRCIVGFLVGLDVRSFGWLGSHYAVDRTASTRTNQTPLRTCHTPRTTPAPHRALPALLPHMLPASRVTVTLLHACLVRTPAGVPCCPTMPSCRWLAALFVFTSCSPAPAATFLITLLLLAAVRTPHFITALFCAPALHLLFCCLRTLYLPAYADGQVFVRCSFARLVYATTLVPVLPVLPSLVLPIMRPGFTGPHLPLLLFYLLPCRCSPPPLRHDGGERDKLVGGCANSVTVLRAVA